MRLLLPVLCLLLTVAATAAEVQTIDDFATYANPAALQAVWQPMEGTPPAEFVKYGDKQALRIPCPFATAPNIERGSYDRMGALNLMTAGAITFDFYCDDASLISYPSIYFHSGDGWYCHSFSLVKGWQHLVLPKGAFRVEGEPAGWDKVDTVRVSAWKSKPVDTYCAVANIQARTEDIAVIAGVAKGAEGKELNRYAQRICDLLGGSGLPVGALTDTDVAGGALAQQKLAIFAYSPAMTPEVIQKVQEYVAAGGKIIVFYSLPKPVADLLGVGSIQWQKADPPGKFAHVAFDGSLPGLPASMPQNSWNVNLFEPAGHNARVIAKWRDGNGNEQGNAVLVSDSGAYMGHVLMEGDTPAKQAFMMALVGNLVPGAWQTAAEVALQRSQRVGPFPGTDELRKFLDSASAGAPFAAKVRAALQQADGAAAEARKLLAAKQYPQVLVAAGRYHASLQEAYFLAHKSRTPEWRAVWNHSGTGDCGSWEEAMKRLKAANFNAVVPNMWWGGVAYYDSKLLPHGATFEKYGDQIAQCVAAGKKYGIEVHPWKVNWNLGNAPADFIEKMRAEKRLLINSKGEEGKWLCASNPANQQLEIDTMLEVARNYDVDGIHFDYIRYPGGDGCFCDGCRERFEKRIGKQVENWPRDCGTVLKEEWMQFRCDNITTVVRTVSEQAHKLKPNLKVSAAVFGDYPGCKYGVGQDWVYWCQQHYLDFVCPMDYTDSDTRFRNLVTNQVAAVNHAVPLYAGIGQFITPDDQVVGQIEMTRELGADGFILFNMGLGLAEQTLPNLVKGVTSAPAAVPHRK
ncbi:family 10 glycosylhydrolase [bacterium]|nr:family 10 glycosylhydrolase [bacterium]